MNNLLDAETHELIASHLCGVIPPNTERPLRLYTARGMSGRPDGVVAEESARDKAFFEACGFVVLCPCDAEGVKNTGKVLLAGREKMAEYWFIKDKPMIRAADVVVNCTPTLVSFGVLHEMVLSRGVYWKPTAWLFPQGSLPHDGSIVRFEGDVVADNPLDLATAIYAKWGTRKKRLVWRLKMLARSAPKWVWDQITFLFELPTRGHKNVNFGGIK